MENAKYTNSAYHQELLHAKVLRPLLVSPMNVRDATFLVQKNSKTDPALGPMALRLGALGGNLGSWATLTQTAGSIT